MRPCFQHRDRQTFTKRGQDECVARAITCIFLGAEVCANENDGRLSCQVLELLFVSALAPASDSQDPILCNRRVRFERLPPCANQARHILLWMKSSEIKQNLSTFSKFSKWQALSFQR